VPSDVDLIQCVVLIFLRPATCTVLFAVVRDAVGVNAASSPINSAVGPLLPARMAILLQGTLRLEIRKVI